MSKLEIPVFTTKRELFSFLKEKKELLYNQKKFDNKFGDGVVFKNEIFSKKDNAFKAGVVVDPNIEELKVKAIINTTNILDSHDDVHLPGLWKKSLSENKMMLHLQEHNVAFDKIIADGNDLSAYTKTYTWKELGYNFEGKTEALVFESVVRKSRNQYMHSQYVNGYVKNHSVGMRYVKMVLCVNDSDDLGMQAEYEAWEKYFPEIVNKEVAEERGFFWAIKEAKVREGSAVPIGSNFATPTLETGKGEPSNHSQDEPSGDTQEIDYAFLGSNFKL